MDCLDSPTRPNKKTRSREGSHVGAALAESELPVASKMMTGLYQCRSFAIKSPAWLEPQESSCQEFWPEARRYCSAASACVSRMRPGAISASRRSLALNSSISVVVHLDFEWSVDGLLATDQFPLLGH